MEKYKFFELMGSGTFGYIYKAYGKNDETLVIKLIPKKYVKDIFIMREVAVLRKLSQVCEQFILCYIDFEEDETNYYIITEFLGDYIDLIEFIQIWSYNINNVKTIANNLQEGLQVIHSLNVAHRDIKPDNIMVDPNSDNIKYIDFGFACAQLRGLFQFNTKEQLGTRIYMAPEILYPKQYYDEYFTLDQLKKSDIWSLGMTIFCLIKEQDFFSLYFEDYLKYLKRTNHLKYKHINKRKLEKFRKFYYDLIKDPQKIISVISNYLDNIDPKLKNTILSMIQENPSERKLSLTN